MVMFDLPIRGQIHLTHQLKGSFPDTGAIVHCVTDTIGNNNEYAYKI